MESSRPARNASPSDILVRLRVQPLAPEYARLLQEYHSTFMGCAGKEEVDILSGLVCIAISQGVRGARPQINMGLLERTMREIDSASQKINTAQWWRRWWRRWYYTLTAQKWDSQLLHCWEGPHGALNTAITDAREHLRQLIPDEAESDRGLPSPNAHLFRSANVNVNGGNMINIVVINVDVRSSESASN